jgi:hypothetical protein
MSNTQTLTLGRSIADGRPLPIAVDPSGIFLTKNYFKRYFLSAYSNQTQTNPVANTENIMTFNNTAEGYGISVNTATFSQTIFQYAGTYSITFSAQLDKTDSGTDTLDIWLKKNGTNVADSNTRYTLLGNNAKQVAIVNYILSVNAGDYFQFAWSSPDVDVRLYYEGTSTTPTRPAIPSVILTILQI